MLPTRHLGKPAPETWFGIVDGIYAIALTIVVLSYPQLILDAIDKAQAHEIAYGMLGLLLFSHALSFFGVFFTGFEIWSIHRALLSLTVPARGKTVLSAIVLSIVAFAPVWVDINNHPRQEYLIAQEQLLETDAIIFRSIYFVSLLIVFAVLASLSLLEMRQVADRRKDLIQIMAVCRDRCWLVVAVYLFSLAVPHRGALYIFMFAMFSYFGRDFWLFCRARLARR
jgi:uncharacterized membrane protein